MTAIFAIFAVLLIISGSIALPIYIRPFYYAHIEPLELVEKTNKSEVEIKAAYDEILDYLTIPGGEFGAGSFKYSEEGKSHFGDCKGLFLFDTAVLIISIAAVVTLGILAKKKVFELCTPFNRHVLFTAGVSVLGLFSAIALIAAVDFDRAFTVFHTLFFPGKDNWIFDPRTDEIILALPQTFFMNCAILIVSAIIIASASCILFGRKKK